MFTVVCQRLHYVEEHMRQASGIQDKLSPHDLPPHKVRISKRNVEQMPHKPTQGQPPGTAEKVDVVWSWVVWT